MIDRDLDKFLADNEDGEVWLLIPSGLIKCRALAPGNDENAPLKIENAVYYLNEKRLPLEKVIIRPDQVYGWAKADGVIGFEDWGKPRE